MPQREPERDVALLFVERDDAHLSGRNECERREGRAERKERAPHEAIIPAGRAGWAGRWMRRQAVAGRVRLTQPYLPTCPTCRSEANFESQLELPLLGARRIEELIRVRRNGRRRIAQRVDGRGWS